jgi:hypothetical protein
VGVGDDVVLGIEDDAGAEAGRLADLDDLR